MMVIQELTSDNLRIKLNFRDYGKTRKTID